MSMYVNVYTPAYSLAMVNIISAEKNRQLQKLPLSSL